MADDTGRLAAALADRCRIELELGAGGMATVRVTGAEAVDNGIGFWSADSRTLYYQRRDHVIVSVTIGEDGTPGRDRVVANAPENGMRGFDPNGTRFLVQRSAVVEGEPDRPAQSDRIVVITNWLDELRRRMGESR